MFVFMCSAITTQATVSWKGGGGVSERQGRCLGKGGGACHGVSRALLFVRAFTPHLISLFHFTTIYMYVYIYVYICIYMYIYVYIYTAYCFFFMHMHTQGTRDKKTNASTTSAYEIGQASSKICLASVRSMRSL